MVDYTEVINEVSQLLFKAISEREPDLRLRVHQLDRELYKLLRAVGLQVVSMLLGWLSTQVTQEAKATGLIVHRPTGSPVPYGGKQAARTGLTASG